MLTTAEVNLRTPTESAESFEMIEANESLRMDAAHHPVVVNYWGDKPDNELIANLHFRR